MVVLSPQWYTPSCCGLTLKFCNMSIHVDTCAFVQAYYSVIIINSTAPSELNHVGVPECMGVCTHWLVVLLLLWCLFFFFFFYQYVSICQKGNSCVVVSHLQLSYLMLSFSIQSSILLCESIVFQLQLVVLFQSY